VRRNGRRVVRRTLAFSAIDLDWNLGTVRCWLVQLVGASYLRRSASSVRNTVQSSSFLRGSVLMPLKFSCETFRGRGGTPVGLRGVCGCVFKCSFSVEKDLGMAGTGGTLTVALKRPLKRLFFLLKGTGCWSSGAVSLASDVSGMLTVWVGVFRLLASRLFLEPSSFFPLSFSREGDDESFRCCWSCETIHDFLRSFDRDRAGELLGDSFCLTDCLTASLRPLSALRSDLRSVEGSLLLLEKGRNLEDRRVVVGASGLVRSRAPLQTMDLTRPSYLMFRLHASCAVARPRRWCPLNGPRQAVPGP
jgi:hypothetical protein